MNRSTDNTMVCGHCGYEMQYGLLACRGCGARVTYNDGSNTFFGSIFMAAFAAAFVGALVTFLSVPFKNIPVVNNLGGVAWEAVHGDGALNKAGIFKIIVSEQEYDKAWNDYRQTEKAWRSRKAKSTLSYRSRSVGSPRVPNVTTEKIVKKRINEKGSVMLFQYLGVAAGILIFFRTYLWSRRAKYKAEPEFIRYYPRS